jgi:hypothetical protein
MKIFRNLSFKVVLLTVLLGLTYQAALTTNKSRADVCENCVFPTGGICVGCAASNPGESGNTGCWPVQEWCDCAWLGDQCYVLLGE